MVELRRLVLDQRLVTVTGAGGVGKTRSPSRSPPSWSTGSADGVWWVDLAPVSDADRVASSVAAAAGLVEVPGTPVDDLLTGALATSRRCS